MKKSAFNKDIFRDIRKSKGRFISIIAIVALGVAFFSGVKISPVDMKKTADKYFDDYNLMDIRLLSTLGLTDDDSRALKEIEGVQGVFPTYSMDALTTINSKEYVLKVHGLPTDKLESDNLDYINRVHIVQGRYPEKSGECVIEKAKMDALDIEIGTTITLASGLDTNILDLLKTSEYKVVGVVETPYYLTYDKGKSNIGNGQVNNFIMIPNDDFISKAYTEIFLTIEGAKNVNSYNTEYFDIVDSVKEKVEKLGEVRAGIRYDEVLKESKDKINSSKKDLETKKILANEDLEKAKKRIEESKLEIEKSEEQLDINEKEFNLSISKGEEKIRSSEEELLKGEKNYLYELNIFNENKKITLEEFLKLENLIMNLGNNSKTLKTKIDNLEEKLKNPLITEEERLTLENELKTTKTSLENLNSTLESTQNLLQEQKNNLSKGEEELYNKEILLKTSRDKLENEKIKLKDKRETAEKEFSLGREKIEKGNREIIKGEEEYNKSKNLLDEQIKLAESKIKDGEEALNELEKPEWFVLDRNSHFSYIDYGNSANSIDALAKVFPVFFFMVAALVCLTTMTRMVDEQRVNIGTLKALGYSKGLIASKYIIYALLASIIGSSLGLAIGLTIFPKIVFDAYGIMYTLPKVILEFNIPISLGITLTAILVTTLSAFFACYKELIETPSTLMRPKAPKEGKRILLERVSFIWNKLNFIGKVTIRNILRYKKRFLMTIFGIAGCTALLLTGFGIKDSIETIASKQFGEIFKYNMVINLDKKATLKEKQETYLNLSKDSRIINCLEVNSENGKVHFKDSQEKDVNLIVPKDLDNFKTFISLKNRKTGDSITLSNDGVVISEKVAKQIKANIGDEISIINSNNKKGTVRISAIAENYTFNYIYITPEIYNEVFRTTVEFNSIFTSLKDTSKEAEDILAKDITKESHITGVSYNSVIKKSFDDTIKSLNYVVLIMIASAGALAFVVLYNLTNVNISERMREIATIKVLGFYDNEVSAYIYRENIILTLVGTILGLGVGGLLHKFIMVTVEMDNMMFGRVIDFSSFIYSIGLTLFFALLVNFTMYYKLKNIKMVESLKSVD
ncbi:FtsX-like permease family protein [Clostridium chauvoei]|uniref:FtsX-like permease family protein n=4 Tax=Clostridium chauvoei TaxID=46867 RepID=A0ABD4RDR7_9CLOT|nr:FtsX-like permease family protein [Clostridium chauvoei]ATD55032.1 ABC transporter permease [Clostridium chauvoei]MBX7279372.1 FtsX-like permease family protein [Clostridium chauvoei]MBX7283856.1 FtsX-like permease family protein [Clostridium chauvoei]MBX7285570.1 FtsX-like permease family protein [Clostridium chauvoei]MBX7288925.1 FtsX-like permease family protein [Clostridium chauvoei]